jgi:tRNA A-37 threonylcarbamoyl transferase component Bud32
MTPDQRKSLIKRSLLWAFGLVLAITILPWGVTGFLLCVALVAGAIYLWSSGWRFASLRSATFLRPPSPDPRTTRSAAPGSPPPPAPAPGTAAPQQATDTPSQHETVALLGLARATSTAAAPRFTPPSLEELAAALPQFTIEALIGSGGMGAVYRVRQKDLDRVAALKVLPRELAEKPGFQERFTREAKALAGLTHPHLVTVYEVGQDGGWYWLLMELVDGANLREVMRTGRLSPEQALTLVPQLCDALQYAHDRGVVHRDIKPENILLDAQGRLKLTDFGLVKLLGDGGNDEASTLTQTGAALGTVHYMAPEQVEGARRVDHRADIYAVGVVLYEMLTGGLPLGRFQPPSQQIAVDVRVDEVVLKALEKDPERRYQRAGDVRRDVERVGVSVPSERSSTEAPPTVPPIRVVASEDGDPPDTDRRFLPAVMLAVVGISMFSERLGAAFAPLVRHLAEAAQALAAEPTVSDVHIEGALPYPDVLPIIAAIAGLGMVLGAWSLLTLRGRALAVLGGVCSLVLAPVVYAITGKEDASLVFAAVALLLSLWLLYATARPRTGRCFERDRLVARGMAVPGLLAVVGWSVMLACALFVGLGISAYAVTSPHVQALLPPTTVVRDGQVEWLNVDPYNFDRSTVAAGKLQAIRRECAALVSIAKQYQGLNHTSTESDDPSLASVLMRLELVERGDPLGATARSATRMGAVERACDDARAAIAAVRAHLATGPSPSEAKEWPPVMVMQQITEHLRALDQLFIGLRQSAGDLGTVGLRSFHQVLAILEGLTSERLATPAEEARIREDITRWWYSREQVDFLLRRMREDRAPAAMLTWLRAVLDTRSTDLPTPLVQPAAAPVDADDALVRDRAAEAQRLVDCVVQEVDKAQASLIAAPTLARAKDDNLVILRGGIGHLVSSAEGAEVSGGDRVMTVQGFITVVRHMISEARAIDDATVAEAQQASDQTLYLAIERFRHHLDLADEQAARLKPLAADLGTMRLDEFTAFAKQVAGLPDRLRRFDPAERARFAFTPGGWLSRWQVRRLERILRDQQATDDEVRLFLEAVSTRITDPSQAP